MKELILSEGIDGNKTSASKACIICHYQYFLDKKFKFPPTACNGYHDILMFIDINSIAILNVHGVDYCCFIIWIIKKEAINVLKNNDLSKRSESF